MRTIAFPAHFKPSVCMLERCDGVSAVPQTLASCLCQFGVVARWCKSCLRRFCQQNTFSGPTARDRAQFSSVSCLVRRVGTVQYRKSPGVPRLYLLPDKATGRYKSCLLPRGAVQLRDCQQKGALAAASLSTWQEPSANAWSAGSLCGRYLPMLHQLTYFLCDQSVSRFALSRWQGCCTFG